MGAGSPTDLPRAARPARAALRDGTEADVEQQREEAAELGDVLRELVAEGEAPQKVHGT